MRRASTITLVLVMALSGLNACSSGGDSASKRALTKAADANAIHQLESVFHQSVTAKDIESMMSLWSDDSQITVGGKTITGKEQIRKFWLETAAPFKPENHWVSETPAYKIRVTANGDRGTLYFECHYIDVDSHVMKAAVSADVKVSKFKDRWMFTNVVAAPATIN
jgi:ketosteroid isomerase-like protein